MRAETIFQNAITFDEVSRIKKEKIDKRQEQLNKINNETLSRLQELINNCRLNNDYFDEYYIHVCRYNREIDEMLKNIGFKTRRYNAFSNWFWDIDDNLNVRDDDLYKLKSNKSKCTIL